MQPERAAAFAPPNKLTKQRAVMSLAQGAATAKNWEDEEPGLLRATLSCVTHHSRNNAVKAKARLKP